VNGGADTTSGTLLDGKVVFAQPAHGYRAAIDPVLLAAAVTLTRGRALELGAGSGAASLCLAARCPDIAIVAVEIDADTAALARRNAVANGFADRVEVVEADVVALPAALRDGFDAVFFNPPFDTSARANPSPEPGRRRAHVEGEATLATWIAAARRALRPRGRVALVHRADRLPEILALLDDGFGDIEILPLWPVAKRAAKRVILRARLGARGGAVLHAGLVLHRRGGAFTAAAERVLRGGESLDAVLATPCAAGDRDA
jgi:tRNA1(Val) A37 N6-methylase TrmN6